MGPDLQEGVVELRVGVAVLHAQHEELEPTRHFHHCYHYLYYYYYNNNNNNNNE
jgi:hypothetical protein